MASDFKRKDGSIKFNGRKEGDIIGLGGFGKCKNQDDRTSSLYNLNDQYTSWAYVSFASLLLSMTIEMMHIYIRIRMTDLIRGLDFPLRRWRLYFWSVLPLYWASIVAAVTCLVIEIKDHRDSTMSLYFVTMILDILSMILTISMHKIVVQIYLCRLVQDRISLLSEFVVELEQFDECAICIEEPVIGETVRRLGCGHMYHKTCIELWLIRNPSCPQCRRII